MTEETKTEEVIKPTNEKRIQCETKKGKLLELGFNGSHWIAYDEDGKKYGAPFIQMNDLKDSLGIDYDKSEPVPEAAKKEAEPETIRLAGEMEDGTEVECRKDKYHWRCFDKNGKQMGEAFINLYDLKAAIKVKVSVKQTGDVQGVSGSSAIGGELSGTPGEETPGGGPVSDGPAEEEHPESEVRNVRIAEVEEGTNDVPDEEKSGQA